MVAAWKVCVVVVLCALLPLAAHADEVVLSTDCQQELEVLWSNYTNPAYTFDSCDAECLSECKVTLESAIYTTKIQDCPLQSEITKCFQVRTINCDVQPNSRHI